MATMKATTESNSEVPIFLRKTYHMIDTCNQEIACWSEDGETFVVKDPLMFEKTIIPQFFKHSKFSSFVRQLNFYAFRKIKYSDSLKIDPKLEEETANYWRFRHENFRRGKPELLSEIKRMNGHKVPVSGPKESPDEVTSLDYEKPDKEVQSLKEKIEEMTKNIDQLTQIVQKVTLKQDEHDKLTAHQLLTLPVLKRKKLGVSPSYISERDSLSSELPPFEESFGSDTTGEGPTPDNMLSKMDVDLEDLALPVTMMAEVEKSPLFRRQESDTSQLSDSEFVDQLFTAFNSGDEDLSAGSFQSDLLPMSNCSPRSESPVDNNRPDPELMKRLGDALMLLPKQIQEIIVDRLIAAITSTEGLEIAPKESLRTGREQKPAAVTIIPTTKVEQSPDPVESSQHHDLPLAAATFAALLRHYHQQVQEANPKSAPKAIPVIPVHA